MTLPFCRRTTGRLSSLLEITQRRGRAMIAPGRSRGWNLPHQPSALTKGEGAGCSVPPASPGAGQNFFFRTTKSHFLLYKYHTVPSTPSILKDRLLSSFFPAVQLGSPSIVLSARERRLVDQLSKYD